MGVWLGGGLTDEKSQFCASVAFAPYVIEPQLNGWLLSSRNLINPGWLEVWRDLYQARLVGKATQD